MIDAYLRELRRRLPRLGTGRFLAETEEHLRDAAARHLSAGLSATEAERRAVDEFGRPEDVAAQVAGELAVRAGRPAAALVLAAALLYVVPLYGIPENVLPPAPWPEVPAGLALGRDVAVALWLAAVALAAVGLAARLVALSAAALGCLACSATVGAVVAVAWDAEAPATPLVRLLLLTAPLAAVAVLVPAAGLLYVRRLRGARAGAWHRISP